MEPITLVPIGRVVCEERDAARQDWSRVRSQVVLDGAPDLGDALLGLADYSHVIVVGWLHEMPEEFRQRRQAYPGGDSRYPLQGSLALRGGRPNPISVTVCRLRGVEGLGLGDVKLATVAGGWLGPTLLAPACLAAESTVDKKPSLST